MVVTNFNVCWFLHWQEMVGLWFQQHFEAYLGSYWTKICFLPRLDWIFFHLVTELQLHVKNLLLQMVDQKQWTFGLILKWRNVGRQSNGMNAFFSWLFMVNYLPILGCCFRLMTSIFWPSSHDFSHHARSSYIWIHWVAWNNVLRRFHHQLEELCQLKVYVQLPCSSQKEYIFSPAIMFRSSCSAYHL